MGVRSVINRLENPKFASRVSSVIVIICWTIWAVIYVSGIEKSADIQHDNKVEVPVSTKPSLPNIKTAPQKHVSASKQASKVKEKELSDNAKPAASVAETPTLIQEEVKEAPVEINRVELEVSSDIGSEMRSAEKKVKSLFQAGRKSCQCGNIDEAKFILSEMESISSSLPSPNSRIDSKIKELRRKIARAER